MIAPPLSAPSRRLRASRDGRAGRRVASLAALVALALGLSGCLGPEPAGEVVEPVRVAAQPGGEGRLLAALLIQLLEDEAIATELVTFGDPRDARQALELGAVDVAVGYTGEAWLETLGRADPPGDAEASFGPVRVEDARRGITWLPPRFTDPTAGAPSGGPPADATFAFVVAGPPAVDADLRTVSQLASRLGEQPDATVCVDREFGSRDDGLRAVLDAYRVRTDRPFLATSPQEAVQAVALGRCVAGLTTATDGAAWAAGLRPLVDDLDVFPAFVVAPQVREELLVQRPEVGRALAPFAELTTAALGTWNGRAVAGVSIEQVAADAAADLRQRAAAAADEGAAEDGADGGQDDGDGSATAPS